MAVLSCGRPLKVHSTDQVSLSILDRIDATHLVSLHPGFCGLVAVADTYQAWCGPARGPLAGLRALVKLSQRARCSFSAHKRNSTSIKFPNQHVTSRG
jgi:hypothetical protein